MYPTIVLPHLEISFFKKILILRRPNPKYRNNLNANNKSIKDSF